MTLFVISAQSQARMTRSLNETGSPLNASVFTSFAATIPAVLGAPSQTFQINLDNSGSADVNNLTVLVNGTRLSASDSNNIAAGGNYFKLIVLGRVMIILIR